MLRHGRIGLILKRRVLSWKETLVEWWLVERLPVWMIGVVVVSTLIRLLLL